MSAREDTATFNKLILNDFYGHQDCCAGYGITSGCQGSARMRDNPYSGSTLREKFRPLPRPPLKLVYLLRAQPLALGAKNRNILHPTATTRRQPSPHASFGSAVSRGILKLRIGPGIERQTASSPGRALRVHVTWAPPRLPRARLHLIITDFPAWADWPAAYGI